MTVLAKRVAALPGNRQRLLERLMATGPMPPHADAAVFDPSDPVKQECLRQYDSLNRSLNATVFGKHSQFLNYGYVPDSSPHFSVIALPEFCINKNSVRLVLETIGDCDVDDKRVLDVGCGRGGTVSVLLEYFKPASVNAVDLSVEAVAFCRETQKDGRARFEQADAERLPFPAASFDVVTNIESSCCYPHLDAFYREVHRVLRPGGWFLYTDCLPVERVAWSAAELETCGFVLARYRDITTNVLLSCDAVAGTRVESFDEAGRDDTLVSFLGVPGSANYELMRTGQWRYWIRTLQKPETEART